jgi:hypothetical protein
VLTAARDRPHCEVVEEAVQWQARQCGTALLEGTGVSNSSQENVVMCPLCHGHGLEHKELLVVRWRSQEFEQALQTFADEAAFGTAGGMDEPLVLHPAYNNESD